MRIDTKELWEACGGAGPLQLGVRWAGAEGVMYREFKRPFVLVGSSPISDVALEHGQVSQRHAYLQCVGGKVFCLDLGSRTGVRWDDGAVGPGWLVPGRRAHVGPFVVWLRQADGGGADPFDAPSPLQGRYGPDVTLPGVVLEPLTEGPAPPPHRLAVPLTVVGTAGACGLRLTGRGISRFHCGLLLTPAGAWVVDLQRGTRVNGHYVLFAGLDHGDVLQVGPAVLRVRYEPAAAGPAGGPPVRETSVVAPVEARPLAPRGPDRPAPAAVRTAVFAPPGLPSRPARVLLPEPAAPRPGHPLEGGLLLHLADQVGAASQQMGEQHRQALLAQQQTALQHQQTMLMVIQLLGTMHFDQMDQVRHELARLHEVTRELQTLHRGLGPPRFPAPEEAAPEAPPVPAAAGPAEASGEAPGGPGEGEPAPPAVPADPAPGAAAAAGTPAPGGEATAAPSAGPSPYNAEAHHWVSGRLAALHDEQSTLWQKVLTLLSGAGLGRGRR